MSKEAMKMALDALEETRNALAWFYDSYPQDVTKKGDNLLPQVQTVLIALREAMEAHSAQQIGARMGMKRTTRDDIEHGVDYYRASEVDALLAEQPKQSQQSPTKAMIDAAERIDWSDSDVRGNIVNMWQAMCAVAPQPAPVQEPVAFCDPSDPNARTAFSWPGLDRQPHHTATLYTTPQPAQRKPLTDAEISNAWCATDSIKDFVKYIEAAHGIKENT